MVKTVQYTYEHLATMPAEEFDRTIYYTMVHQAGNFPCIRVKYYYVDPSGVPSSIQIVDTGVRIENYGQSASSDSPQGASTLPGAKCSFKVMYGKLSASETILHPDTLGPEATPADKKGAAMLAAGMRLIMLVAKDCVNFKGFMGPEAVFAQSTPYETRVPKGKLPRTKMLNGTPEHVAHFSKFMPKLIVLPENVSPSVDDINTAINFHVKQFSSELILQKYHTKGHVSNTSASLTRYYPQVDYRTAQTPNAGTSRVIVLASMIDDIMAKSTSQMKPAPLPKPINISGPGGVVLPAYNFAPWEVLGGAQGQEQLRVGGNLIVTPEMFFGSSQKVLRCVVDFVQVETILQREAAAPPAFMFSEKYGAAAVGSSGADEDPAPLTFGTPSPQRGSEGPFAINPQYYSPQQQQQGVNAEVYRPA
jgi:hypothetical protein